MKYEIDLINFEFKGNEQNNTLSLNLDEIDLVFCKVSHYDAIISKLKSGELKLAVTTKLTIKSPRIITLKNTLESICWLLSYATGTEITYVQTKTSSDDGSLLKATTKHPKFCRSFNSSQSVIESRRTNDLAYFLGKCYKPYLSKKDIFRFPILFDYYLEMKDSKIIDMRFLLLYLVFEALKSSFDKYLKENFKDIYDKQRKSLGVCSKCKRPFYSPFQESIKFMIDFFKIKHCNLGFLSERNKIIHTGKLIIENIGDKFERGCNVFDKIILTILEYDGHYLDLSANKKRKLITEQ